MTAIITLSCVPAALLIYRAIRPILSAVGIV